MIEWAREMLTAAENAPAGDARDAILTRVGAVLFASHGIVIVLDEIPSADRSRNDAFSKSTWAEALVATSHGAAT